MTVHSSAPFRGLWRALAERDLHRVAVAAVLFGLGVPPPLSAQDDPPANDQAAPLRPVISFDGPVLELDFPALHIGVAEYDEGPTGATVFYFPDGVIGAVDVRGGGPGTVLTDLLRLGYETPFVSAISFAGGSAYGLAAAAGVAAEIKSRRVDPTAWDSIAVVPGAIIFDLGGRRFNAITPDEALGRAALRTARPGVFPLGARGAGRFAMQGSFFGPRRYSGQGGAFRQVGPTKIAVFTVVNARGTVVDRDGRVVRCSIDPEVTECGSITTALERAFERMETPTGDESVPPGGGVTSNTTITLVVTNQRIGHWALQRLATHVHSSMARAIQPFHTENDGDALFAVTTGEVTNADLAPEDLYVLAADVAWDAVLSSVPDLPARETQVIALGPERLAQLAGDYDFGTGAVLSIRREGARLLAEATGTKDIYGFRRGDQSGPHELRPTSALDFLSQNESGDRIRFVLVGGRATGLILNPGPWGLSADRIR